MAKGPKHGRLFHYHYLQERNSVASALFSDSSSNKCQLWNRLGHPHSKTLMSLFNSGLLLDNKVSFKDVSFNCSSCKMGKSKTLPFPMSNCLSLKYFDLLHSDV